MLSPFSFLTKDTKRFKPFNFSGLQITKKKSITNSELLIFVIEYALYNAPQHAPKDNRNKASQQSPNHLTINTK